MSQRLLLKEASARAAPVRDIDRGESSCAATIQINGWRPGFRKVAFVSLLDGRCGYELAEAKRLADRILEGRVVDLEMPSTVDLAEAAREIHALGANVVSVAARTVDRRYRVLPKAGGWAVKRQGASRATRIFANKAEAVAFARAFVRNHPSSELIIHRKDGSIAERKTCS